MHAPLRQSLTYANVVATLALFLALGGGAFAAVSSIPSASVVFKGCVNDKTGVLRVVLKGKCRTHKEVAISWNEHGVPGLTGGTGPQGAPGATGTPDTSDFYTKGQSDARYPPIGGTAANAAALDGAPASAFESSSLFGNSRPLSTATKPESGETFKNCVIGELKLIASSNFAPSPTVFADGQILKTTENEGLFSLIGFNYGGNGTTTFALPDLHGLGPDGANYVICMSGIFPSQH